jgi:ATP-dependent RNA helicase RhlE
MSFEKLGLAPSLLKTLKHYNFEKPYPIQLEAIPAILKKKDILGIAQTGSGKTASFVLPILTNLLSEKPKPNRHIDTLVVVPTRELAMQVHEVFRDFSADLPKRVKSMAVYGGVSINPQMMKMNGVNVLVATPGRLIELLENKALHLDSVSTLVLDEADKILNLGFKEEMDKILGLLPKKRQNLLFSATLSEGVEAITRVLLNDPITVKVTPKENNVDLIKQIAYRTTEERKGPLLRYIIKNNEYKQILIFASTVYKVDNVADKLRKNGINAQAIHAKKSQQARTAALSDFKKGHLKVLVATDLLARGIDIEFLPCVINYELPRSPKDYIHRIGRTGRAESPGDAITLVSPEEQHHFRVIQKKMKKWVDMVDSEDFDLHGC